MRTRTTTTSGIFGGLLCTVFLCAPDALAAPRTHDGFYMEFAPGLGYLSTSASAAGTDVSFSGMTLPFAFLLGGSPFPGFVVGGEVLTDYEFSPKYKLNGQEAATGISSQYLIGIGPFVDFYPNPAQGLHFQGMIGWGGLETSFQGNVGGSDPTGLVVSLAGGYDFWVADEWSIGVMARFGYGALSLGDVGYKAIAPALLATFTYH